MAQLKLSSSEPVKMIRLIEQMFPGVQLDSMEKMIEGVVLEGTMKFSKKISTNETVVLEVVVVNQ